MSAVLSHGRLAIPAAPSPHILRPYDPAEACTIAEAAAFLGITPTHARRIVERYDLGRRINGGRWRVSRMALYIYADCDQPAMDALRAGRKLDPALMPYLKYAR